MSKQMDFMANQVFAYFTLSEKNEYHPRMFALLAKATISVSLVDISLSFKIILCQKKIAKKLSTSQTNLSYAGESWKSPPLLKLYKNSIIHHWDNVRQDSGQFLVSRTYLYDT